MRPGPRLYTAVIKHAAPFAGDLDGLYWVHYDGNWYAFTHLEPLAARKAFPGFDEPVQDPLPVTIHRRAGDVAIANEESISVSKEVDQWVAEQFKQTQPSPTYLVALAVGPFDILEQDPIPPSEWRKEPIRLRGIAAKGKAGSLQYALDAHREVLLYRSAP